MASLFLAPTSLQISPNIHDQKKRGRIQIPFSCRSIVTTAAAASSSSSSSSDTPEDEGKLQRQEDEKEMKKKKKLWAVSVGIKKVLEGAEKVRGSFSPKRKGDWKDLVLMSLSFAVYVYISQRIVCAYCAWMAILKN